MINIFINKHLLVILILYQEITVDINLEMNSNTKKDNQKEKVSSQRRKI